MSAFPAAQPRASHGPAPTAEGRLLSAESLATPLSARVYRQRDGIGRPFATTEDIHNRPLTIPADAYIVMARCTDRRTAVHLISIAPGGEHGLDCGPQGGRPLLFQVLTEERAPASGATLRVRSTETPPGNRDIRASHFGWIALNATRDLEAEFLTPGHLPISVHIAAPDNKDLYYEQITARRPASLRIRVLLEALPLPGADCELTGAALVSAGHRQPSVPIAFDGRTDADGECIASRLPPGDYWLSLRKGRRQLLSDHPAHAEGTTTLSIDLETRLISGTVRRVGAPAAGTEVSLLAKRHAQAPITVAETVTDVAGRFQFQTSAIEDYWIYAKPEPSSLGLLQAVRRDRSSEDLVIQLPSSAKIGRVVDSERRPVPGARVQFETESGLQIAATTPSGEFTIESDARGKLAAYATGLASTVPAIVSPGESAPTLQLHHVPATRGWVRGQSTPMPNVFIAALPSIWSPERLTYVVSDQAGWFSLQPPTASDSLVVGGRECALKVLENTPTAGAHIACGDREHQLILTFQSATGRPIPGVTPAIRQDGRLIPSEILRLYLAGRHLPTRSNASGRLAIKGLPPGVYEVLSNAPNPAVFASILLQSTAHLAVTLPAPTALRRHPVPESGRTVFLTSLNNRKE